MFWIKPPLKIKPYLPKALWNIETGEKTIYLTFDDGPHPQTTDFILGELERFNFTATFFCLGQSVAKYPELFEQIKSAGHAVGNHTYHHLNAWTTDTQKYLADVEQAHQLIQSSLFRPPYGRLLASQNQFLKDQYKIVMWSHMPEDFRSDLSSEKILNRLIKNSGERNLIVLHENDKSIKHLQAILPRYLQHLKENGYTVKRLPYDN